MKTTAIAHANIALVKYWGKRNAELNLPAAGSISMTLKDLYTRTSVEFRNDLKHDRFILNGAPASPSRIARVSRFLNLFREKAAIRNAAEIISENNFPTGAGLASSASGFAALSVAASHAAGLYYPLERLSEFARRGSGSAARSIFGGFVEMQRGKRTDGGDAFAVPLYDEQYWPLEMLILITSEKSKDIGSTAGMEMTAATSPYYRQWINSSEKDLAAMREALAEKDFQKLGEIAEHSCLKMHGLALSARPGVLYWNEFTVALIREVRTLRRKGMPVYFTIDAGPQVKVICLPEQAARVAQHFAEMPGVRQMIHTTTGPGARVLKE